MRGGLAITLMLLVAGCAEEAGPDGGEGPGQDITAAAASGPDPQPAQNGTIPIVLDGSTATQVMLCVEAAPPCRLTSVVDGTSDLMFEGLEGNILGGQLSMTWAAESSATEELAFGFMVMGGKGEECAPHNMGMMRGRSPLAIEAQPPPRALCPGEVVHVWASNGIYLGEGPAYAQLDVDQPFHIEGSIVLGAPTA